MNIKVNTTKPRLESLSIKRKDDLYDFISEYQTEEEKIFLVEGTLKLNTNEIGLQGERDTLFSGEYSQTAFFLVDGVFVPDNGKLLNLSYTNDKTKELFPIKKVIFNYPATIVIWEDGTKTIVQVQNGEEFDEEKGLALCLIKKITGNTGSYNEILKKWAK